MMNDIESTESVKQHFWAILYTVKFKSLYYELCLRRAEFIQSGIEIFLAVATSSSIGGWLIWREYSFFWAAVIAMSQVINAIMPHLPYKDRIKSLSSLVVVMELLILDTEKIYFNIQHKNLSAIDIGKKISEINKKINDAEIKYLLLKAPKDNEKFKVEAQEKTEHYFNLYYPDRENI